MIKDTPTSSEPQSEPQSTLRVPCDYCVNSMLQTEHEAYNGKCQMCRTLGTEYGYLYLLLYKVDCDSDMRRHVFVCPQENLTLAEETAAQYLRDEYDIDSEDEDTDVEVEYEHVTQIKSVQGYNVTARK